MSFNYACSHCGTVMEVEDEWIGMEAQCPTCEGAIVITGPDETPAEPAAPVAAPPAEPEAPATAPPAEPEAPVAETADTQNKCPSCAEVLAEGAVLCVHCGYNLQTGEKAQVNDVESEEEAEVEAEENQEEEIEEDSEEIEEESLAANKKPFLTPFRVICIIVVLLLLAGGGVAAYMLLQPKKKVYKWKSKVKSAVTKPRVTQKGKAVSTKAKAKKLAQDTQKGDTSKVPEKKTKGSIFGSQASQKEDTDSGEEEKKIEEDGKDENTSKKSASSTKKKEAPEEE